MKEIEFLGDSRKAIREFGDDARRDAGFQLRRVQRGEEPSDWKLLSSVGGGVTEIRLWDETGTYRVIFTAKFEDAVYVLHAFQKKTRTTSLREIALVRRRYAELIGSKGGTR